MTQRADTSLKSLLAGVVLGALGSATVVGGMLDPPARCPPQPEVIKFLSSPEVAPVRPAIALLDWPVTRRQKETTDEKETDPAPAVEPEPAAPERRHRHRRHWRRRW